MSETIRTQDTTKHLKYEFDNAELLQLGEDLAAKYSELAEHESALNTIKADFKQKFTDAEGAIASLVRKLNAKNEYRDTDCEQVWNYENGTYSVTRKDTKEIVEERALTDGERQMELSQEEEEPDENACFSDKCDHVEDSVCTNDSQAKCVNRVKEPAEEALEEPEGELMPCANEKCDESLDGACTDPKGDISCKTYKAPETDKEPF